MSRKFKCDKCYKKPKTIFVLTKHIKVCYKCYLNYYWGTVIESRLNNEEYKIHN